MQSDKISLYSSNDEYGTNFKKQSFIKTIYYLGLHVALRDRMLYLGLQQLLLQILLLVELFDHRGLEESP